MERVLLNVRISPAAHEQLKKIADKYDFSISQVARMCMGEGMPTVLKKFPL
jgi:hypothetical protein